MNTAPLALDHIIELGIETESMSWLNENGFPTDAVGGHSVVSESGKGYVVLAVETLQKPLDVADAVEDETTIHMCTCPHFRYRCIPEEITNVKEIGSCKHIRKCVRSEKAKADENQETL